MATTLERAAFAAPNSHWVYLKLLSAAGVAAGNTLTITRPDGGTLVGTVKQLLPYGSVTLNVTSSNRLSGVLLLPKGSSVA